jgi:thiamine kinase-like enzyme
VHNDLSPKNVLVDRSAQPPRILFVDWEMAGVGCGALDLVHLKYGFERQDEERMCAEYCGELAEMDFLPSGAADLNRMLAAADLHKTLYRLACSRKWNLPIGTVATWVSDAQELFERV